MTAAAIAYMLVTTPALFMLYSILGKWYLAQAAGAAEFQAKVWIAAWRLTKFFISIGALYVLWALILHVGEGTQANPFGWILSAFYTVLIGGVYVAVDRYINAPKLP
jgi:hypothetical protein